MNERNGKSFCEALHEKFSSQFDFENLDNIIVRALNCPKESLEKRKIIGLDHCNIASAGKEGEIQNTCPSVQELDLSSNFIENWTQIFNITKQLQHLISINISHNPLDIDTLLLTNASQCQSSVKHLVVNNARIGFDGIVKLLDLYPSVSVLHCCINGITEVPQHLNRQFENVATLSLAKNGLRSWADIKRLGKLFPNLVSLNVSENSLGEIHVKENAEEGDEFPNLEHLNLMECCVDDWQSIESLQHLPKLKELRIKGCPVYMRKSLTEKQQRHLTVARLPNLTKLNGSPIEEDEREDAERMFIRFHMKGDGEKPNRYHDLVANYGKLDELAEVNYDTSFVVNVLVTGDVDSPFLYPLDCSQTVRVLYKELGTRLKVKRNNISLIHVEGDSSRDYLCETLIDRKLNRRMTSYHVREGDTIKIVRLDLEGKD